MKLRRLEVRGLSSAFRASTATIDFDALPPGLICFVGNNGAGKTTLMEAIPAALYRVFPSYDESFAAHVAPGVRDAMVRLTFDLHEREVVVLVQADPQFGGGRGKVEAFVTSSPGATALDQPRDAMAGPNLRDVDNALRPLLPPLELFLASVFACQGGAGSFFELGKGERKALFAAMLGLEKMQALADRARDKGAVMLAELAVINGDHEAAAARARRAGDLDVAVVRQGERLALLDRAALDALESLACAENTLELARDQRAACERAAEQQSADAIATTARRLVAVSAERDAWRRTVETAERSIEALRTEHVATTGAHELATEAALRIHDIEMQRGYMAETHAQRDEVVGARSRALAEEEAALARSRAAAVHHDRIVMARSAINHLDAQLADAEVSQPVCDTCPLLEQPRVIGGRLASARLALERLGEDTLARDEADAEAARVRVRSIDAALERLNHALSENERHALDLARDEDLAAQCSQLAELADGLRRRLEAEGVAIGKDRQHLADLEARVEAATAAHAEAEAGRRLEGAESWIQAAETRAQACHARMADAKRAATFAADELGVAGRTLEGLQGERRALGDDPALDAKILEERATTTRAAIATWSLLERGLGRDGVQALEVDAAGPGVTAIANDLLHTCYGPRFSLAIETTAPKKDGSGTKEVFEVRILDSEVGREARRGSGGEMVLIDEALRLALAIWNTRRSGYELRTLFRDETVGALSPANADRYVAMLERARTIGGFHHVLMIAQQPEVWAQAAARVLVRDGAVEIDA